MKLKELAKEYKQQADDIYIKISILKRKLREEECSINEIVKTENDIKKLYAIYCDTLKLSKICDNYYERGFFRDEKYSQNVR